MRLASLSLDLDNEWSYMKIHGDPAWKEFPSYLNTFVPYVLKLLTDLKLEITFFVVGQDAALSKNKEAIASISENGHELGNHSFSHESWIHKYSTEKVREEIIRTEESITAITGVKPVGFRGPGFSCSSDLLKVLHESNYLYDASTLPTFIGPIARLYYFKTSHLTKAEKEERSDLFGSFKEGLKSVKPYYHHFNNGDKLLEIPVTTIPIIKIPFHLSYLLYLSRINKALMHMYLQMAIRLCILTRTSPSFLLHPLDLISGDQVKELKFFPGMDIPSRKKKDIFIEVISALSSHFQLVNMKKYADLVGQEIPIYNNIKRLGIKSVK